MQRLFFYGRSLILSAGFLLVTGCGKQEKNNDLVHTTHHNNHDEHVTLTMPEALGHAPEIPTTLPESQSVVQEDPVMPTEALESSESLSIEHDMGHPHIEDVQESVVEVETEPGIQPIIENIDTRKDIKNTKNTPAESENINFEVENRTGKTIFVTCFSYIKKRDFSRWRWDKSNVYRIEDNASAVIDIDAIEDRQERNSILGYLAIFNSFQEAEDATYQLLKEENQIDLDKISALRGKKVVIEVEKYGMRGEFLEFDFIDKATEGKKKVYQEVDFPVENRTGKPLFVTCFVYEKKAKGRWLFAVEDKDDVAIWRFDKTNVIKIMPGEEKIIDVDTITVGRDREYLQGYLAIFDEDEEKQANDSIYELLESNRKLYLGSLFRLQNKKVVLEIEKYGVSGNFIDFTVKPVSKIDFTKIIK